MNRIPSLIRILGILLLSSGILVGLSACKQSESMETASERMLAKPEVAEPAVATNIASSQARATLASLPLHFEANQGQTDAEVKFLSRGSGYTLFLTASEAVLVLRKPEPQARPSASLSRSEPPGPVSGTVLRMSFIGAEPHPQVAGAEELPGRVNYFIGSDPSRWRTDIPTYANVAYRDVYPGIDLVYHGPQGRLQYDFIVQPGADPAAIGLAFQGVERLELDPGRRPGAAHRRRPGPAV